MQRRSSKLDSLLSDLRLKSLMGSAIRQRRELLVNDSGFFQWLGLDIDRTHVAMKVGVPVVPGTPGPVATYTDGDAFIKEHGFPGRS